MPKTFSIWIRRKAEHIFKYGLFFPSVCLSLAPSKCIEVVAFPKKVITWIKKLELLNPGHVGQQFQGPLNGTDTEDKQLLAS
ncbi:hypothetical protein NDU88_001473 [Pleurodeles waltl]|uniref:Uncharacterized protein n=1 Tax=Pleurodeles waltl TaxID=8319 RepID=A0AAV7RAZ5_PLEWA|nr:hypothetical protein NDU88_001473 [Pleurodeles waltl]